MHWSNLRSMVIAVCSTSIRVTDCDADDVQRMLSQDGYLRKLANRVQSHLPSKRDGAITALTALGNTQGAGRRGVVVGRKLNAPMLVRAAVTEAIRAAKTIHVLVARLNQKSTALAAASVLAHLVRIGKSPRWTLTRGLFIHPFRQRMLL